MEYKGVPIILKEVLVYKHKDYTVKHAKGKLIFSASSKYGESFSVSPKEALDGAKSIVDKFVK